MSIPRKDGNNVPFPLWSQGGMNGGRWGQDGMCSDHPSV